MSPVCPGFSWFSWFHGLSYWTAGRWSKFLPVFDFVLPCFKPALYQLRTFRRSVLPERTHRNQRIPRLANHFCNILKIKKKSRKKISSWMPHRITLVVSRYFHKPDAFWQPPMSTTGNPRTMISPSAGPTLRLRFHSKNNGFGFLYNNYSITHPKKASRQFFRAVFFERSLEYAMREASLWSFNTAFNLAGSSYNNDTSFPEWLSQFSQSILLMPSILSINTPNAQKNQENLTAASKTHLFKIPNNLHMIRIEWWLLRKRPQTCAFTGSKKNSWTGITMRTIKTQRPLEFI